jgi:hypothetical protein
VCLDYYYYYYYCVCVLSRHLNPIQQGCPTFLDKQALQLLWAGLQVVHLKVTVTVILHLLNCFANTSYKCGHGNKPLLKVTFTVLAKYSFSTESHDVYRNHCSLMAHMNINCFIQFCLLALFFHVLMTCLFRSTYAFYEDHN